MTGTGIGQDGGGGRQVARFRAAGVSASEGRCCSATASYIGEEWAEYSTPQASERDRREAVGCRTGRGALENQPIWSR